MIDYDFHIHTEYCGHAKGMLVEQIIRRADERGLCAIAITDHVFGERSRGNIELIRRQAEGVDHKCRVIIGAEVDVDGLALDGRLVTDRFEGIDYVIGSIHYVPGEGNYPNCPEDLTIGAEEMLERWSKSLLGLVSNERVDTLSHPGRLIATGLEFDPFWGDILAVFSEAGELSAKNNIMWEINELNGEKLRAEYRQRWHEIYEVAIDKGVKLIFGSDAHRIGDIGKCDFAYDLVERLGGDCLCGADIIGAGRNG